MRSTDGQEPLLCSRGRAGLPRSSPCAAALRTPRPPLSHRVPGHRVCAGCAPSGSRLLRRAELVAMVTEHTGEAGRWNRALGAHGGDNGEESGLFGAAQGRWRLREKVHGSPSPAEPFCCPGLFPVGLGRNLLSLCQKAELFAFFSPGNTGSGWAVRPCLVFPAGVAKRLQSFLNNGMFFKLCCASLIFVI